MAVFQQNAVICSMQESETLLLEHFLIALNEMLKFRLPLLLECVFSQYQNYD